MIRLYRRLVRNCKTVNQQNKVLIELENRITPRELDILQAELRTAASVWKIKVGRCLKELRRQLPWAFASWHKELDVYLSASKWLELLDFAYLKSGKSRPEPFRRYRLVEQITVYKAGDDRSLKTLVICFSGNAQRMMMPMPVFLQHLDASSMDVAFLRDSKRNGFRNGIAGIAPSFELMFAVLGPLLKIDEYRRVVAIGTSNGAMPAVLAAMKLGLDAGLAVGTSGPEDPRWRLAGAVGDGGWSALRTRRSTKLLLAFGADSPKDKERAEALAAIIDAQLVPVTDDAEPVGHNALYALVQKCRLTEFLNATIFDFQESKHFDSH